MHYLIYKTTNTLDNHYYIGCHRTIDIDDGYLGSGLVLQRAIKKHGRKVFSRTILKECTTQKEMYDQERAAIGEAKNDPLCYNIHGGGQGGNCLTPEQREKQRKISRELGKNNIERLRQNSKKRSNFIQEQKTQNTEWYRNVFLAEQALRFANANHNNDWTDERRAKLSEKMKNNNPQRGLRWVNKDGQSKQVSEYEFLTHLKDGWVRGKRSRKITHQSNKMWINDGISSKFVSMFEEIPEAWVRGRIQPTGVRKFT